MSARDVINEALAFHLTDHDYDQGCALRCGYDGDARDVHLTDALIAAVRSMPVEDQAELIGGDVKYLPRDRPRHARVVGDWIPQ